MVTNIKIPLFIPCNLSTAKWDLKTYSEDIQSIYEHYGNRKPNKKLPLPNSGLPKLRPSNSNKAKIVSLFLLPVGSN